MAVYQVLTVPNEILRTRAQAVEKINAGVLRVLDNLRDTMYAFDGVGLAAPQIGISRRIIVVDTGDNLWELINPEIIFQDGEQTGSEGCLSVPGLVGIVKRAQKVTVKALDRRGEVVEIEASDLGAKALQHEIDHLDGIIFTDKALHTKKVRDN